ncbi:proliferation marker protein Ki-67 isoform X2 [Pseudoliparis swirei]|uniref:proliferation marker protein Ki-67 isoform X2 n=1 Tax=Pseudoliparis swirei TaxID=2059687 RepID=UPI0024BDEB7B|nr:proliferation marker protein Ki-67 isoform X2 [Pseudoliparis swirei]
MPLHGKIVVIKRSGGDGTEFPLTAACLFGRKPDCDIRIQLPQVSKEHCRIDFNENKEIILTNLSSVNPTRVNGEALQHSERLKHGDVITVIDRSFRFEYPPPPTPKKRASIGGKAETFKVLQNQQVGDAASAELGEKRISEVSTDPHLKDGTNYENIQRPLEKTQEDGLLPSKTASPFSDLYQMIKKSLDVKTPRKSSASVLQTPTSRFCTPKPGSIRKNDETPVVYKEDKTTPKKDEAEVSCIAVETEEEEEAETVSNETPKSVKKQRRSFQVPSTEMVGPEVEEAETADQSEVTSPQKRICTPPQRFTPCEVVEQISAMPKSPVRRTSPRNSGKVEMVVETSKKRERDEQASDLPTSQMKRVSFGGLLCPELFDKCLPPNSPLCKGATPRRSASDANQSLLRRSSAIGSLQINTPSPVADDDITEQVPFVTVTPLRRRSTSWETPSQAKSAVKVLRRSGISRASMKVKSSWADIVKFGQTKTQVAAAPAKKMVAKKTAKAVAKPQTPARNLKGHVSTGHADSPVTIVVGRAHKQTVVHPTSAAPKLVNNIALLQKHMKMDEDLTGISEMLKPPGNEMNKAPKTQVGGLSTSVAEPSVLNTPEESGEMMVSPLTVSSTMKDRSYSSEAVQRLFNDQESSIVGDGPAVDESADLKTTSVTTPKQKPQTPDCLIGVKRMMKTPKQKAEPIEDLRGKILKTPTQKPEIQECLTGVKKMMKTPKQKAEPIEDLRGKILKTPKQKPETQECLTGVKKMMTTPRQEVEPVEDIKVELLTPPTQKPEQQECLTEVEAVCNTPQPEAEPLEDQEKSLEAPEAVTAPAHVQEPEDLSEKRDVTAESVKSSPLVCLSQGKKVVKTPKMLTEPSAQPEIHEVADQAPLDCDEDVAKELIFAHEEPQDDVPTEVINDVPQLDMKAEADAEEVVVDDRLPVLPEAQPDLEAATIKVTNLDTAATVESLVADAADDCDAAVVPTPVKRRRKKSEATASPAVRQTTRGRNAKSHGSASEDQPETAPEKVLESTPASEISTEAVSDRASPMEENDCAPAEEEAVEKPARGRKTKQTPVKPPQTKLNEVVGVESLPADAQPLEKPRRGRKTKPDAAEQIEVAEDAVFPMETKQQEQPPVRAKRGRSVKQEEEKLDSVSVETTKCQEPAKKLRRTKKAAQNQASEDQADIVPEPEMQQSPPVEASDSAALLEKAALKPKQGRKAKQPEEQQDVPTREAEESETCSVAHSRGDKNKSAAAMETAPVTESLPEVETATCKVTEMDAAVPKKSVRGRRAKLMEDKQEASDSCDDAVVPTPARGRRGKKSEAAAPPAENDSAPAEEEAVTKPTRGRKSKQTPIAPPQPELNEVKSLPADAQPLEKPRRGRKTKPDAVEQNEVAEDTVVAPVRAKRVRIAKQEEEKQVSASVEMTKSQEPAKKLRRTKKAEQDREEVHAIEMVPDEVEAPIVAEPVKMKEQAAKPRRGRKATEDQEVPAVDSADEPEAPVVKRSRAKASVKTEVSQATPVKKARRGAALPLETSEESTVEVSEPAATSVAPAKRSRRAAAAEPTHPSEDSRKAVDTKPSKRSVRGKAVVDVPQATPVKAVRGRKSRLVDTESNNDEKAADETEEMDLSDKVAEAQPAKRTRKMPKVAEVKVKSVEADARLKTRRGRSAKE